MIEEKIGYIDAGREKDTACVIVSDGTVSVKMTNLSNLVSYLLSHELDIAWNEEDYGELYGVFVDVIGYPPKGKEGCII